MIFLSKERSEGTECNSDKDGSKLRNTKAHLNVNEALIKKLEDRKKINKEFLAQIESFIGYAKKQVKNNDNHKLRLKYLEIIEEEESLRDKIRDYLKKNDKLIESIKKSSFNLEL